MPKTMCCAADIKRAWGGEGARGLVVASHLVASSAAGPGLATRQPRQTQGGANLVDCGCCVRACFVYCVAVHTYHWGVGAVNDQGAGPNPLDPPSHTHTVTAAYQTGGCVGAVNDQQVAAPTKPPPHTSNVCHRHSSLPKKSVTVPGVRASQSNRALVRVTAVAAPPAPAPPFTAQTRT